MVDVDIPTTHGELPAYLAVPTSPGPWPGVVVIHDVMGMSHDLRRQTDWLAGMGYLAAAPDLYRGGRKLACIRKIMRDARQRSGPTFDDIEAVRSWLTAHDDCTGRVGVIGYCMGGGFALMLAPSGGFCAASVNYGTASKDVYPESFLGAACPIVGSYGAKDRANPGTAQRLEQVLTAVRVDHDIKVYPEAGHSFLNDHDSADIPVHFAVLGWFTGSQFHEASANDARRRIVEFFDRHLKS
jgi:carboxymethylenebutenolidase